MDGAGVLVGGLATARLGNESPVYICRHQPSITPTLAGYILVLRLGRPRLAGVGGSRDGSPETEQRAGGPVLGRRLGRAAGRRGAGGAVGLLQETRDTQGHHDSSARLNSLCLCFGSPKQYDYTIT